MTNFLSSFSWVPSGFSAAKICLDVPFNLESEAENALFPHEKYIFYHVENLGSALLTAWPVKKYKFIKYSKIFLSVRLGEQKPTTFCATNDENC